MKLEFDATVVTVGIKSIYAKAAVERHLFIALEYAPWPELNDGARSQIDILGTDHIGAKYKITIEKVETEVQP